LSRVRRRCESRLRRSCADRRSDPPGTRDGGAEVRASMTRKVLAPIGETGEKPFGIEQG
jgi:hypothetical protein